MTRVLDIDFPRWRWLLARGVSHVGGAVIRGCLSTMTAAAGFAAWGLKRKYDRQQGRP